MRSTTSELGLASGRSAGPACARSRPVLGASCSSPISQDVVGRQAVEGAQPDQARRTVAARARSRRLRAPAAREANRRSSSSARESAASPLPRGAPAPRRRRRTRFVAAATTSSKSDRHRLDRLELHLVPQRAGAIAVEARLLLLDVRGAFSRRAAIDISRSGSGRVPRANSRKMPSPISSVAVDPALPDAMLLGIEDDRAGSQTAPARARSRSRATARAGSIASMSAMEADAPASMSSSIASRLPSARSSSCSWMPRYVAKIGWRAHDVVETALTSDRSRCRPRASAASGLRVGMPVVRSRQPPAATAAVGAGARPTVAQGPARRRRSRVDVGRLDAVVGHGADPWPPG